MAKKLESGIIYNDYELSSGMKYIYKKTVMRGKPDYKRSLTVEGIAELKDIAAETEYRTLERHRRMDRVWDMMTEEA